jgi:hypothetical protein
MSVAGAVNPVKQLGGKFLNPVSLGGALNFAGGAAEIFHYDLCVPRYNCKGASTRPAMSRNNPDKTKANLIPKPPIK